VITSQQLVPKAHTGSSPAVATNGKSYFLAWNSDDDQSLWWTTCPATSGQGSYDWAPVQQIINAASSAGPALACLDGVMWMAWKGEGTDTHIYLSSLKGSTWSPGVPVSGIATSSSPALAVTASVLFLAWKRESDDQLLWSQSSDGKTWQPQMTVPGGPTGPGQTLSPGESSDAPALVGFKGIVYFAWKGATDNSIWLTSLSLSGLADSQYSIYQNNAWAKSMVTSPSFLTNVGPALAVDNRGNVSLAWKGQTDNAIWTSSSPFASGWSPQSKIAIVETVTRPALSPQVSAVTDILLAWKGASSSGLWFAPLDGLLSVQLYTFDIPTFHISNMRSGHAGLKDGTDTDYVSMSVKVRGQPISTVTQSVGNQTGQDYPVDKS
jgi:hypothetical protein